MYCIQLLEKYKSSNCLKGKFVVLCMWARAVISVSNWVMCLNEQWRYFCALFKRPLLFVLHTTKLLTLYNPVFVWTLTKSVLPFQVCFFIRTDLEKSSAVNGCRQNGSPNRWWQHYNSPQVIHTTPVHQLCFVKLKSKCLYEINPSLGRFYPLSIILLSSWLNQERNTHRSSTI